MMLTAKAAATSGIMQRQQDQEIIGDKALSVQHQQNNEVLQNKSVSSKIYLMNIKLS